MSLRIVLGLVTLLSAFLLFQVQPLVARAILPDFGGTPAVWTTCLLFFQCLLVAGYGYGHWLHTRLEGRRQAATHLGLMSISLLVLGLAAVLGKAPLLAGTTALRAEVAPQLQILRALGLWVGVPYLVLSTTAPLIQVWLHRLIPGASPYRLYALSNAGSLLGLLGYPLLVEPALGLSAQAWTWSALYLGFVALTAHLALRVARSSAPTPEPVDPAESSPGGRVEGSLAPAGSARPRALHLLAWTALGAIASALLLAVTNEICQDVAPVPLLWVVPLSLYLLTFILCFEHPRWYARGLWMPLYLVSALVCGWLLTELRGSLPLGVLVGLWSTLLVSGCMVCHGELARSRPHPRHLTGFYLAVAVGGALGGIFVAVLAPLVFQSGYLEVPVSIGACALVVVVALWLDRDSVLHRSNRVAGTFALVFLTLDVGWMLVQRGDLAFAPVTALAALGVAIALAGLLSKVSMGAASLLAAPIWPRVAAWVVLVLLASKLGKMPSSRDGSEVVSVGRNFFGLKLVLDEGTATPEDPDRRRRVFWHGKIIHGMQLLGPELRQRPISYFVEESGVARVLQHHPRRSQGLRIGVLGLGVGMVAAYTRPSDVIRFYEIDPEVPRLSTGSDPLFYFLSDSPAQKEILIGDGRVLLAEELRRGGSQQYDLLQMDAFSGDSVPVHLLSREALELYFKHLRAPDGVLALHITNAYLDLRPMVRAAADALGLAYVFVHAPMRDQDHWESLFALLARSPEALAPYGEPEAPGGRRIRLWTDEYSNLLSVIK